MATILGYILCFSWAILLEFFDIWQMVFKSGLYSLAFSAFMIIWSCIITTMATVGILRFSIVSVICAIIANNEEHISEISIVATMVVMYLWTYWSWWTMSVISIGVVALQMDFPDFVLRIWMLYSVYCAVTSAGWLGFIFALNLTFLSSKFLRLHILTDPSWMNSSLGQNGTTGIRDPQRTEFTWLLNSSTHYSTFGLSLFENVDAMWLRNQFNRKAVLVHPIIHPWYEDAAVAFQKLQNAFKVLVDPFKRQAYDSGLRRELIWNFLRQLASFEIGRPGIESFFRRFNEECEDPHRLYRCIFCSKCHKNYHLWVKTSRSASRGRWCQDCKVFHPTRNGEVWVEEITRPILLGLLYKKDQPMAYVCAYGKVFQATEWYLCQGVSYAANTHEPGFTCNFVIPGAQTNERIHSGESGTDDESVVWVVELNVTPPPHYNRRVSDVN